MKILLSMICIVVLVVLFIQWQSTQVEWRAIIVFTDRLQMTEDWNWFYSDIKEVAQEKGILVIPVNSTRIDVTQVQIRDSENHFKTLDISDYVNEYHYGYLFLQEGDDMQYYPYGPSTGTLEAASKYFGVRLEK